jgi:dTDP-glucose pyrophosphorylase
LKLTSNHIINIAESAREALRILSSLNDNSSLTLFVVDSNDFLKGTVTDGDIRRGLLNNLQISQSIGLFMNPDYKFVTNSFSNTLDLKNLRNQGLSLIPLLDSNKKLLEIIDLKKRKAALPISALIMAGGRGERLKPLTDTLPKPMLLIGDKPIIEHNIDRLISFGIKNFFISVRYLKESIISYFGDGSSKGVKISYIEESDPLGTIGSITKLENIKHEDILVMNSDILTNIDFEDFYNYYKKQNSHMMLASIPYVVAVPYAVLNTKDQFIQSFEEKPTYTYYSNGGIYLMKYILKNKLEVGESCNATDLMDILLNEKNDSLTHYPILGYWLDIGRHSDYLKAQEDIKHINLY